MSRTICIPCLNMEYYDCEILIHRWSKAECSKCGKKPHQALLVSIVSCPGKRRLSIDQIRDRMKSRRPLDDDYPDGYQESDRDFVLNNCDLCVDLLEEIEGA